MPKFGTVPMRNGGGTGGSNAAAAEAENNASVRISLFSDGGTNLMGAPLTPDEIRKQALAVGAVPIAQYMRSTPGFQLPQGVDSAAIEYLVNRFANGVWIAVRGPDPERLKQAQEFAFEFLPAMQGWLDLTLPDPDLKAMKISTIGLGLYPTLLAVVDPFKTGIMLKTTFWPTILECQKSLTIMQDTKAKQRESLVTYAGEANLPTGPIDIDCVHGGTPWNSSRIDPKHEKAMMTTIRNAECPPELGGKLAALLNLPWPLPAKLMK